MTHRLRVATGNWLPGLLARLRVRLSQRSERGDAMIDTLIFMAVISLVAGSYTASAHSANQVSRSMTAIDIVDQRGQGVLEQAQVQPWETLGFNPVTQKAKNNTEVAGTYDGKPTVRHNETVAGDAPQTIQPYVELPPTRGVKMTQSTFITWADTSMTGIPADAYGTKHITVIIEYHAPGVPGTKTKTYSSIRSATPSEAVPTSIQHIDEAKDRGDGPDATKCPQPYYYLAESGGAIGGLRWAAVPGASEYILHFFKQDHLTGVRQYGNATLTGTSVDLLRNNAAWLAVGLRWTVEPVIEGTRIRCNPKPAQIWRDSPPECVSMPSFAADGRTLQWAPVPGATEYRVLQRNSAGAVTEVAGGIMGTTHLLTARPEGSQFHVVAFNSSGSATGCSNWTAPTPGAPPVPVATCPPNFKAVQTSRAAVTITWDLVAGADVFLIWEENKTTGLRTNLGTYSAGPVVLERIPKDALNFEYSVWVRTNDGGLIAPCPFVSVTSGGTA